MALEPKTREYVRDVPNIWGPLHAAAAALDALLTPRDDVGEGPHATPS